jgi:hypothetical protein
MILFILNENLIPFIKKSSFSSMPPIIYTFWFKLLEEVTTTVDYPYLGRSLQFYVFFDNLDQQPVLKLN